MYEGTAVSTMRDNGRQKFYQAIRTSSSTSSWYHYFSHTRTHERGYDGSGQPTEKMKSARRT